MLIILIVFFFLVYLGELLLWEERDKVKLLVYTITMIGTLTLSVLLLLGVDVPSPASWIEEGVNAILR